MNRPAEHIIAACFERLSALPGLLMLEPGDRAGLARLLQLACAPADQPALQRAARSPGSLQPMSLGLAQILLGDAGSAAEIFSGLAQQSPDLPDCWHHLGMALWLNGQGERAAEAFRQECALTPESAPAWRRLGGIQFIRGEVGDAAHAYERAVSLKPDWFEARRNLARTYLDLGHMTQAIQLYRALVSTAPDNAELRRNLGVALLLNGEIDGAADACRDCLALDPQSVGGWRSLGFALLRQREWLQATEAFRQGTALADDPVCHHGLWLALEQQRLPEAAAARQSLHAAIFREERRRRGRTPDATSLLEAFQVYEPTDFRSFFGSAVEAHPLPPHDDTVRSGRMPAIAFESLLIDRAWQRRGLQLVRDAAVEVLLHEGAVTPHLVREGRYVCEKPYQTPPHSLRTRTYKVIPEDRDYRPLWFADLTDIPVVTIAEPCVYLAGSPNYGHFLIDTLPKLAALDRYGIAIDLPIHIYGLTPFFRQILECLFPDRNFVGLTGSSPDTLFRFERATIPDEVSYGFGVQTLRHLIDQRLPDQGPQYPDRLFLSRRNYPRPGHRIDNDAEIADHLAQQGFTTLSVETLSFPETVTLFRHASTIVTCTGAQNGNIPFLSHGAKYIELSARYHERQAHLWTPYNCLGAYAGADYRRVVGEDVYRSRSTVPGWVTRYRLDDIDQALVSPPAGAGLA